MHGLEQFDVLNFNLLLIIISIIVVVWTTTCRLSAAGIFYMPPGNSFCDFRLLKFLVFVGLLFFPCHAVQSDYGKYVETADGGALGSSVFGLENPLASIVDCFPGVILLFTNTTYYCEINGITAFKESVLLYASYYTRDGRLFGGWPATVEGAGNFISFIPGAAAFSGWITLVITEYNAVLNPPFLPITTNKTMELWDTEHTHTSFFAPFPYYGLHASWEMNIPKKYVVAGSLLVHAGVECQSIATNCDAEVGCYNVTESHCLPLPGNYSLCVTADGWRGHYLPWGQSYLEVKAVVATPLYIMNGTSTAITLKDARLDSNLSWVHQVFLAPCLGDSCPTKELFSYENVVDIDACRKSRSSDRIRYLEGWPVSLKPGKYAVCAELFPCDANSVDVDACDVSSSALSVTVFVSPFALTFMNVSIDTLVIGLAGGDLGFRSAPYDVCLMPSSASCDLELSAVYLCVTSSTPNSLSLEINRSRAQLPDSFTLCLVAVNTTFLGHRYMWIQTLANVTLTNQLIASDGLCCSTAAVAGIALGVLFFAFLSVVVLVVCYLHYRRARILATRDGWEEASSLHLAAVAGRHSNPLAMSHCNRTDTTSIHSLHGGGFSNFRVPPTFVSLLPIADDESRYSSPRSCHTLERGASATSSSHRAVLPESGGMSPVMREGNVIPYEIQSENFTFETMDEMYAFTTSSNFSQLSGATQFRVHMSPTRNVFQPSDRTTSFITVRERGASPDTSVIGSSVNDYNASLQPCELLFFSLSSLTASRVALEAQAEPGDYSLLACADANAQGHTFEVRPAATPSAFVDDTLSPASHHRECPSLLMAARDYLISANEGAALTCSDEHQTYEGRDLPEVHAPAAGNAANEGSSRILTPVLLREKGEELLSPQGVDAAADNENGDDACLMLPSVAPNFDLDDGARTASSSSTETVFFSTCEPLPRIICIDSIECRPDVTFCKFCEYSLSTESNTSIGESECDTDDSQNSLT
ncbi:hypothetical protein MOQ_001711 [Trypanosoma cruzi marinkellei]|uniref:Uncharacterized protein n=1 Tax=Trypanosoma cruzi marinkellei TaxID=85056 RepID=K2NK60_TRYCR|nr:hypothetical protein MOQ_001711 [Trypanosoma cruzi marinkellei]